MPEIAVFKKISIGGREKAGLIRELAERGVRFNAYANTLFEHPSFSPGDPRSELSLAKVSLVDLGLTRPAFFAEIVDRAAALGLRLCPLYLGAFLRLEYLEQPPGPYLTVASTKPERSEEYPSGFYLRNLEDSLWLRGYRASDDYEWPVESEFVFLH